MSGLLLAITALLYVGVAVDYGLNNNPGMAIVFMSCAMANMGFLFVK